MLLFGFLCLAMQPGASLVASRFTSAPALPRHRFASVRAAAEVSLKREVQTQRKATGGRLNIRIDDEWYDLTNWRMAHPAGTHWIDAYNNSECVPTSPDHRTPASLHSLCSASHTLP